MTDPHYAGASTPRGRRNEVVAAEKDQFGGMKFGSAFFGWLAASGLAVLLTALLGAVGAGVGVATTADVGQAVDQATQNPDSVGWVSAIVLAAILFLAYYAGGYVAGRMARFDGVKQGIAVWLWAILIAIVLAILGVIAGSQFNVLGQLNSFPRIPINEGTLTAGGVIALIIAVLIPLIAAVLGGMSGMRFHRKVDQVGINHQAGLPL
ncbi:hypothetical protein GMA12_17550 [Kocuria sediminis]|uniref:Uncharacterized protein n=1 Tax=Kocuria sediminis TaxID=1038857 RepID=A0A6N8GUC9_9MICC|nr:hypothetical protein [Kocuria sediminis]MUN64923.1 hypothetical protein [Kocuria sediminis]